MSAQRTDYFKKVLFRVRWLIMSDKDRYAYLWERTRNNLQTASIRAQRLGSNFND